MSTLMKTGTAGLLLAAGLLIPSPSRAKGEKAPRDTGTGTHHEEYLENSGKSAPSSPSSTYGGSTNAIGTQPEEYRENTTGAPSTGTPARGTGAPGSAREYPNQTSTGRELTGPGAQPGEYDATRSTPRTGAFDTVHNVRIHRDTVRPDTTMDRGRAPRDTLRGSSSGPTRPGGNPPRPSAPRTPREMPGNSGGEPRPGGTVR